ncbi:MAG: DUF4012 domain-containing protein [Actinobacteria bacterium]|nr:DUF4012 domain-containing protein [Actinomycetota bacterium]
MTDSWWSYLALGVVAVVLFVGGLLARELVIVQNSVDRGRAALTEGLAALQAGDADRLGVALEEMTSSVARASAVAHGPVWSLAEQLPPARRSLVTARIGIEAADEAATIAATALGQLQQLSGDRGSGVRTPDGRFDLQRVEEVADAIVTLDVAPLQLALGELRARPAAGVVQQVLQGRAEVLDQGVRLLAFVEDARALASVLPSFFGADGPREYFLAMQNPGELRGTGGLIGFFTTIRLEDGGFQLGRPERYEVLDQTDVVADDADVPLPRGVEPAFVERYGKAGALTFLGNANLDPDLPTVAEVMLDLYERERGRRLDGVLVIDPLGLAYAHAPLGPVVVPPEVTDGVMPSEIPPAALATTLLVDAYDHMGGESLERKIYLQAVAESAFRGIASGRWSALTMLRHLGTAAGAGHLQIYSTQPHEQAVLEELGIAGELRDPEGMDFLALTVNNGAGNKSDVHVAHRVGIDLRLVPGDDGHVRREGSVDVAVENPLGTTGHDIYILGSSEPGRGFVEAFTGPRGLNRSWFTLWVPRGTTDLRITNADGDLFESPRVVELHGLRAVDHVVETPARSTRSFSYALGGPTEIQPTDTGFVYRLRLHRQAKAIADRLSLRLGVPEGWRIVSAAVEGGGNDPMLGPDGVPGPPVEVRVEDGQVLVTGDVTRPVTLEVHVNTDATGTNE